MADQPRLVYPNLPADKRGKIRYLARLLRVEPVHLRAIPDDKAVRALVGVVLFHHQDKPRQPEILKLIRSLPGPARMRLGTRINDTLINRSWGAWSLSTAELKEEEAALETLNEWAAFLGLSFSGPTLMDIAKGLFKPTNVIKKPSAVLSLVIGGFLLTMSRAERRMEDEINRRRPSAQRF